MPAWTAAALIGSGFGAIHYSGPDSVGVLVPLAVLGATFCLLYEWTGSLWTPIALHIANNALAVGATSSQDAAPAVAILVGAAGLVAVVLLARRPSPMESTA
jgi:membrane protease YdiL (CAAX protease family)